MKHFHTLAPFADLYGEMHRQIAAMNKRQLRALQRDAAAVTSSNCSWMKFRVAPLIYQLVETVIAERRTLATIVQNKVAKAAAKANRSRSGKGRPVEFQNPDLGDEG